MSGRIVVLITIVFLASAAGYPIIAGGPASAPTAGSAGDRADPAVEPAGSEDIAVPIREYRRMLQWKFSEKAIPVPEGGVTWSRDCAAWILESGSVRLMEPTADGIVTGMVFEGRGRFRMDIPDAVEAEQLGRFSGEETGDVLDESFTELVLRTTDGLPAGLIEAPETPPYSASKLAGERHERWLRLALTDVDSRVTAGLINPGDEYLRVDMRTERFDWLTYVFDSHRQEEIRLQKLWTKGGYGETWISLDRAEDRLESGRPSGRRRYPLDITHLDIEADLTECDLFDRPTYAEFRTTVTFRPTVDGCRAFRFYLPPLLEVSAVETAGGEALPFIRDRVGKRFAQLERRLSVGTLLVIFDEPAAAGEERIFSVAYRNKIVNFLSGRSWYPSAGENINDRHTTRFRVKLHKKYHVRAVGRLEEETVSGKIKTSVWRTETPTRIYGFTVGKNYTEKRLALDGAPEVAAFGPEGRSGSGQIVEDVAVDVANSLLFYHTYFDADFPGEPVTVTYIDSGHGQAFAGFLQLSRNTFRGGQAGSSQLFRAHEAAHQLWGTMVGWKSYRDQWLSETFAEYSAMLFVEAAKPDEGYFSEILEVYRNECLGSLEGGMSRFARPWNVHMVRSQQDRLGPIGVGHRAGTRKIPTGYLIQTYHKGPLVLHMLRVILRNETGDDALFRAALTDFLHTHAGREASTADFRKTVEKRTGRDWSWFFDQWIHGTSIPEYHWDYALKEGDGGGVLVEVRVRQVGVPDGFRMPVPLLVELEDGTARHYVLDVKDAENVFDLEVPGRPLRFTLNPDTSVLARVKRK